MPCLSHSPTAWHWSRGWGSKGWCTPQGYSGSLGRQGAPPKKRALCAGWRKAHCRGEEMQKKKGKKGKNVSKETWGTLTMCTMVTNSCHMLSSCSLTADDTMQRVLPSQTRAQGLEAPFRDWEGPGDQIPCPALDWGGNSLWPACMAVLTRVRPRGLLCKTPVTPSTAPEVVIGKLEQSLHFQKNITLGLAEQQGPAPLEIWAKDWMPHLPAHAVAVWPWVEFGFSPQGHFSSY